MVHLEVRADKSKFCSLDLWKIPFTQPLPPLKSPSSACGLLRRKKEDDDDDDEEGLGGQSPGPKATVTGLSIRGA